MSGGGSSGGVAPSGALVHTVREESGLYVPGGQEVHMEAPSSELVPPVQEVQLVLYVRAYDPAEQRTHLAPFHL